MKKCGYFELTAELLENCIPTKINASYVAKQYICSACWNGNFLHLGASACWPTTDRKVS